MHICKWQRAKRISRGFMVMARRVPAHPQSAPGDFYVENDQCMACGAPHAVAPDLIGWAVNSEYEHCIWKKQPRTGAELEQSLAVFEAACLGCHRYAGTDSSIMETIGAEYCDHAPPPSARSEYRPPPELRLTLIQESDGILRRVLAALLSTAICAFLIWLLAMRP